MNTTPLLSVHDGRVVCTSENVAQVFNRPLIDLMKRIHNLDCSPAFFEQHFTPMEAVDGRGKPITGCRMSREGFSLWAMSFIGKNDLKEAYLTAFQTLEHERMEARVKRRLECAPKASAQTEEQAKLARLEQIGTLVDQLLDTSTNAFSVGAEIRVELAKQVARLAGVKLANTPNVVREDPDVLRFWKNIRTIGLAHLNHSRQADIIAINMTEYKDACLDKELPCASRDLLMRKLRISQAMPMIGRKSIRSNRLAMQGKTIQCWLFRAGDMLPDVLEGHRVHRETTHANPTVAEQG